MQNSEELGTNWVPNQTLPMSMPEEITRDVKGRKMMARNQALDGEGFSIAVQKMIENKLPEWRSIVRRDVESLRRRGIKILGKLTGRERATAVQLLSYCDNRSPVPMLLNLLRNDSGTRLEASQALASLAGDRAFCSLVEMLQADPDADVRYWAAYALANMGEKRACRSLLAALQKDKDPKVRGQAAEGLGEILEYSDQKSPAFKRAVNALIESLKDGAPEVRFWAAFALGKVKAKTALPELRQVARSDDAICSGWWTVKDEAKSAIRVIQGGRWPKRTSRSKCGMS